MACESQIRVPEQPPGATHGPPTDRMLSTVPLQSLSMLSHVSLLAVPAFAHRTTLPAHCQVPRLHWPTPHCCGVTPSPQHSSPVVWLGMGAAIPLSIMP